MTITKEVIFKVIQALDDYFIQIFLLSFQHLLQTLFMCHMNFTHLIELDVLLNSYIVRTQMFLRNKRKR